MTMIDFPSPCDELINEGTPRSFKFAGGIIGGLISLSLIGSAFYKIDVYATAPGRVEPLGRSKSIQAPEAAIVAALLVHDGSHVEAGQNIIELDPTSSIYDRDAAQAQAFGLSSEISRLKAEINSVRSGASLPRSIAFSSEVPESQRQRANSAAEADLDELYTERRALKVQAIGDHNREEVLEEEIKAKAELVPIDLQKVRNRESLNQEGWKSGADVADAQTDLSRARDDLLDSQRELAETKADEMQKLDEMSATKAKFLKDSLDLIEEDSQKLAQQSGDFKKNEAKLHNMTLRSPVTGTVQSVQVASVGQMANVGQALLTIVPDSRQVNVQALVSDRDMGFVHIGDKVAVKIRAFPFTRYGVVYGVVQGVSRDSLESKDGSQNTDSQADARPFDQDNGDPLPHVADLIYSVDVKLDRNSIVVNGTSTPIRPGMGVEVEIGSDRRTLLEYILSPVSETLSESGHER